MKKYIVCIDSDGCVMDTMNYKHQLCFGPIAADIWKVENRERFLQIWDIVNLYSTTRGINRFKGLYLTFEIMNKEDERVKPLEIIKEWANNSKELSNNALKREIELNDNEELKMALLWSEKVNEKIVSLEGMDKPFEGAKESLETIKKYSDLAIVSSANREAIVSEWTRHNLISLVDELMGQDKGSKKDCIKYLKDLGYTNILMVGDSPGDVEAALLNDVLFYPILFGNEKKSWNNFKDKVLEEFLNDRYSQEEYIKEYNELLNKYNR